MEYESGQKASESLIQASWQQRIKSIEEEESSGLATMVETLTYSWVVGLGAQLYKILWRVDGLGYMLQPLIGENISFF